MPSSASGRASDILRIAARTPGSTGGGAGEAVIAGVAVTGVPYALGDWPIAGDRTLDSGVRAPSSGDRLGSGERAMPGIPRP